MYETISSINNALNSFIWGVPAMVCIIGVGLYLSIRTGFVQVRKFPYALKNTLGKIFSKSSASDGALTPFQAVCTALAATIGTGNIAGVAGAIAIGGPGAVFWMWISALLGMCTKFSEVVLAVFYRERNVKGEYIGGPMYYIQKTAPGPPIAIAPATPAMLPVPIVAAKAVHTAWKGVMEPSSAESLSKILPIVFLSAYGNFLI